MGTSKELRVSIITPSFNSEKTIKDTIESVLHQSYPNIEYIIIDGGSQDSTVDIIKEYQPLFEGRLRYVSEKDKGIYNAMNKGIKMSSGKLIGIINSDDYYELDAVETVIKYMGTDKYQVIHGGLRELERAGLTKCVLLKKEKLPYEMIAHPTCFVTRDVYKDYGLFLERFKIVADYEFFLRLYNTEKVTFSFIPRILANFRTGGASGNTKLVNVEAQIALLMHGCGSISKLIENIIIYIII